MPFPDDSNDTIYYEDRDVVVADGRQLRFKGDVRVNGVTPVSALPVASSGEFVTLYDGNVSTAVPTINFLVYIPFEVSKYTVFDQIILDVTTAAGSSSLRAGIYADDGTLRNPGVRLVDGGSVASDTTGLKTFSITVALQPGKYWACVVAQGGTPTLRAAFTVPIRISLPVLGGGLTNLAKGVTGISGALPTTASPATTSNSNNPCVALRVA